MIPASFEYFRPASLSEAISLLQKHGSDAKILSGGQSLIPMMKLRLASPPVIIDINRIDGLNHIQESDGFLRIGGLTRESDLENSELIHSKYPILIDTTKGIADPVVRNSATIGGNIAHADPANDHPATLLALRAQVVAAGPNGERVIPIEQFFTGLFETALGPEEILTEIRIPMPPQRSGGAYFKVERKVGDFATAAVAAYLVLEPGGMIEKAGIGLTNVGPTVIHARNAEDFLLKKKPEASVFARAAELAAEASQPSSDQRGPAEYKRGLVKTLTVRALTLATERSRGEK